MVSVQFTESLRNLIVREGRSVSLVDPNISDGPDFWDVTDGTDTTHAVSMYIGPVDDDLVDGAAVLSTDQLAYVASPDLPTGFDRSWSVNDGADALTIERVRTYRSGSADVVTELILRG